MPASTLESPLDRGLRLQRDADRVRREREGLIEGHRDDVNRALHLGRDAGALQRDRDRFERDENFREMVADQRATWNIAVTAFAFYALISVADLFLATPEVSRMLADKAVSFISEHLAERTEFFGVVLTSAPYWLRILVGVTLVAVWIGVTYLVKKLGNEAPQQASLRMMEPGQDALNSRLIRQIWLKRGLKIGYLVLLAGFFAIFHSWDMQRARNESIGARVTEHEFDENPFLLPDSAMFAGGAQPEEDTAEKPAAMEPEANAAEGTPLFRSSAALAVYGGLWCLHFCLILLPVAPPGRELPYARFSIARVSQRIDRMRNEEIPLSLAIGDRVLATEDAALKSRLFTITEPLIPRINQLYGRQLLILQNEGATPAAPNGAATDIPWAPQNDLEASARPEFPSAFSDDGNGNGNAARGWASSQMAQPDPHGLNGRHPVNGDRAVAGESPLDAVELAAGLPEDEVPPVNWDAEIWGSRRTG